MKKHIKEQTITITGKNSVTCTVYRLTVNDGTDKIPNSDIEDWFIAFQNGFLEETIREYKLKRKLKRFDFQTDLYGNIGEVTITKRHRWS